MKIFNSAILFMLFSMYCMNSNAQNVTDSPSSQRLEPELAALLRDNTEMVKQHRLCKVQGKPSTLDTLSVRRRYNVGFGSDGKISTLTVLAYLNDGEACPKTALQSLGCKVTCELGNLVIIDLPASAVNALGEMKEFKEIRIDRMNRLMNYQARKTTNVAYVTGENPVSVLSTKYDGSGVIVGVIDAGIDFNHVAFRNPVTGATRIKEAIHFTSSKETDIAVVPEKDIPSLTTFNNSESHGTHTSSIAAGSYAGDRKLQGMAPEADLVLCDLDSNLSNARIIAASNEIFRYADSIGKPAVINLSIGDNAGLHDGSCDIANAFNILTQGHPGHIIAVAAGNEAQKKMTITKKLSDADDEGYQLKTLLKNSGTTTYNRHSVATYGTGIDLFIYSLDNQEFTAELKAVKDENNISPLSSDSEKQLILKSSKSAVTPAPVYSTINGKYCCKFTIGECYLTEKGYKVGLFIKGTKDQIINVIDAKGIGLLGSVSYPTALPDYDEGNGDLSISTFACTDGVISVGASMDRNGWIALNDGFRHSSYLYDAFPIKGVAPYSSYGIDENGIARPDVITPGTYINSGLNIYDSTFFNEDFSLNTESALASNVTDYITPTVGSYSRVNAYGQSIGTSMACPAAAGIIALWLQANPQLTVSDVRAIIKETSIKDVYITNTDSIPSGNLIQAGYGKIDALKGIEYVLNHDNITDNDVTLCQAITIPSVEMGTFSSAYPLDFSAENAPKAYIASAFDGTTLTFTRVQDVIPANTGLLLVGNEGTYNVPIATEEYAKSVGTNLMIGTANESKTFSEDGEAYVLSNKDSKMGFYQNAANLRVSQGKAYLKLENTSGTKMNFIFDNNAKPSKEEIETIELQGENIDEPSTDNDKTDDIKSVTTLFDNAFLSTPHYNLAGQHVDNNYKGIIICGGKKYINK